MAKKKKKKFKIRIHIVLLFLLLGYLFIYLIIRIINIPITNIYIQNNHLLTDQEIIEIAGISDYPSTFKNYSYKIQKKLEENIYIQKAKVKKHLFTQVYIEIEENRPLFFSQALNKTILKDGSEIEEKKEVPILVNYVPDILYQEFIQKMKDVKEEVLYKISEIKYDPDEVDDSRFLLTMTDSNYVYITMNKFDLISNYNNIVKEFDNKKGILYLNAGGYFKIKE